MPRSIPKLALVPFTENDIKNLQRWISSERILAQFAGNSFTYPLSYYQLIQYINDPSREVFKVVDVISNKRIGHCEFNHAHDIPRLSRIIIGDPKFRGKGMGQRIVSIMVERLFGNNQIEMVDLNVFDWNHAAIKCYENIGFQSNPIPTKSHVYQGENWKRINMILKRSWFTPR